MVSLDLFFLVSTGFGLGLGKATQTAWPFFMRTALEDVTRVFLKLALDIWVFAI